MRHDSSPSRYHVVVNHEEQYSIWPVGRDVPAGWHTEGTTGSEEECLGHIDRVWTDIRPLSLRRLPAHTPSSSVPPRESRG